MSQLEKIPRTLKDPEESLESLKTLPDTREQAFEAAKNREALANWARDSAKIVDKELGRTRQPIVVEMGLSPDGKKLGGSVERIDSSGNMLRTKVLVNGVPQASFIYFPGDHPYKKGNGWDMIKAEAPDATGPDPQPLPGPNSFEPSGRALWMDYELGGPLYRGGETVRDLGAMDFAATAQVLAAAAEQVTASQTEEAA